MQVGVDFPKLVLSLIVTTKQIYNTVLKIIIKYDAKNDLNIYQWADSIFM